MFGGRSPTEALVAASKPKTASKHIGAFAAREAHR